jgi:RNA polymerase sigma-70 factor, ECF subfamily
MAGPIDEPQELPAARLGRYTDRMFRVAYALTGSWHDAEDLVQETFARVLARPRFVRGADDARYLVGALRNTWIDLGRARASRPAASSGDALERVGNSVGDPGELALDVRVVFDAMRRLSPARREAVAAVDVFGLSYRDAARALGVRQGTLQSRLARGRDQIAAALLAGDEAACNAYRG